MAHWRASAAARSLRQETTAVSPTCRPAAKNRKSITTWQDEVVLKELKDISHERGVPQQVLIAEGLNYVLTKYRRRTIAT